MTRPDEWELIARLLLAATCGAVVGFERERRDRPAGLRTFMLVAMGAALFGIVSLVGFPALGPGFDDPGRVAAQVVAGIGFLGAAVIFREGRGVKGITTAATVWMMAAIGLAAGAGLYLITVVATLITFLTLTLVRRAERHYQQLLAARASKQLDTSEEAPKRKRRLTPRT
jgi:putative Mg2+ transporter-C (MgtC) family protein